MEILNSIGLTLVSFMMLYLTIRQGKMIRIMDKLTDVCGLKSEASPTCCSKETDTSEETGCC